jgi:superkiller protein 3
MVLMNLNEHRDKEAQFNHALRLRNEGDLQGALQLFKQLIAQYPDFAVAYEIMGDVLWDLNAIEEARSCFQKAVTLKPESELGSLGLFHVLWELGRIDEAFEEMKRFLSIADSEEYTRLLADIQRDVNSANVNSSKVE